LIIPLPFGEYQFDQQAFQFSPFNEETYIPVLNSFFGTRVESNSTISLNFLNGLDINTLPMDEEKANFLIKLRKNNKTGKIDRTIHMRLYFVLDEYMEIDETVAGRFKYRIFANILNVDFFESTDFSAPVLTSIETSIKSKMEQAKAQEENDAKVKAKLENVQKKHEIENTP
jgi:hypothetical protein